MLSLLVIPVLSGWSAVLFMVSSGHVCRQVVGRRSQVQTPTLLTLPVCSSSNTHLLFSFLLSSKTSKMSQLALPFYIFHYSQLHTSRRWFLAYWFSLFLPYFSSTSLHWVYLIAFCGLRVSIFMSCCFRPGKCLQPCEVSNAVMLSEECISYLSSVWLVLG